MTTERRSVLRWLGGSAVLALGGDVLSACLGDAGKQTGARDAGARSAADAKPGFPFAPDPGDGEIYDDWFENTVDPQNPTDILARWKLRIDGMVKNPVVLSFADVIGLERQDQVTDFHCVEGWSVYDVPWNGVAPARLLDLVGADAAATHLTFHGIGGKYSESLPLAIAREPRTLLGYGVGGSTLPLEHGFPLRLVVPRLLGYKNAKHIEHIVVTDHPVSGYWETYGYSYEGEVPSERLRTGKY